MKRKYLIVASLILVASILCGVSFGEKGDEHYGSRAVIRAVVKAIFPSAKFKKAEVEEVGIKTIEVDLMQGDKECSVNVTEDGIVLSTEIEVGRNELPEAVAKAIKARAGKAKITKIEKEEIRAVVKVVELEKPITVYEAKFVKDGKVYEVKVASCGKVLGVEADEDEEGHYGDGDKDGGREHRDGKDGDRKHDDDK